MAAGVCQASEKDFADSDRDCDAAVGRLSHGNMTKKTYMPYTLYDHIDEDGANEFLAWSQSLEKAQRGALNSKLDMLQRHGPELMPSILSDCGKAGLKKLRVKGNVQLRPLLCFGPVSRDAEFTLLFGAKEVQSKWVPSDALDQADKRKSAVSKDPTNRRRIHERVK
jgi:hypothetical protein